MYSITKSGNNTYYDVQEFIIDTPEDMATLPRNVQAGSTAFVISTREVYMMNNKKEWVKL